MPQLLQRHIIYTKQLQFEDKSISHNNFPHFLTGQRYVNTAFSDIFWEAHLYVVHTVHTIKLNYFSKNTKLLKNSFNLTCQSFSPILIKARCQCRSFRQLPSRLLSGKYSLAWTLVLIWLTDLYWVIKLEVCSDHHFNNLYFCSSLPFTDREQDLASLVCVFWSSVDECWCMCRMTCSEFKTVPQSDKHIHPPAGFWLCVPAIHSIKSILVKFKTIFHLD